MPTRSLLLALVCAVAFPSAALAATPTPVLDTEEVAFCQQVNTYRAQNGLAPVKVAVTMTKAARWMSADLATKNYFDHTDSLGRSFSTRLGSFGYRGTTVSENLAAGSSGATATLNQWRNSAPHNQNLLNPAWRFMGIGRAYAADSTYGWYWTADFGTTTDTTIAC
jgi:uncharacterized protein YkwD